MPFYYFKARVEEEIRNVQNDAYLLYNGVANCEPIFHKPDRSCKIWREKKVKYVMPNYLKESNVRFIKTP